MPCRAFTRKASILVLAQRHYQGIIQGHKCRTTPIQVPAIAKPARIVLVAGAKELLHPVIDL